MTTFHLVRHGRKEPASGDAPLSPSGRAQARATARHLCGRPLAAVYSSPLRRASETAAAIAAEHGFPVVEDARLRGRANWGDLPGQSFAEFVAMWRRCTRDPDYAPSVGDSARRTGERMAAFLREVARLHPRGEVVAVTHGGALTDFLCETFSPVELGRWHAAAGPIRDAPIPECSITVIRLDGVTFVLDAFASVPHLDGEDS